MRSSPINAAWIRRELKRLSTDENRRNFERYFKGAVRFHGAKTPDMRKVAAGAWSGLRRQDTSVDSIVRLCFELLQSEAFEEKHVAISLLSKVARELPASFLPRFEKVFDRCVSDWATCDGIASRVLRTLILRDARLLARVVSWSRSRNSWRQRASAVAFVNEARHGRFNREILTVCSRVVRNPERFPQLGAGWVLRELYLADPELTVAFLRSQLEFLSREGLRYAIEKMPRTLQRQLLDEHAQAAAR